MGIWFPACRTWSASPSCAGVALIVSRAECATGVGAGGGLSAACAPVTRAIVASRGEIQRTRREVVFIQSVRENPPARPGARNPQLCALPQPQISLQPIQPGGERAQLFLTHA